MIDLSVRISKKLDVMELKKPQGIVSIQQHGSCRSSLFKRITKAFLAVFAVQLNSLQAPGLFGYLKNRRTGAETPTIRIFLVNRQISSMGEVQTHNSSEFEMQLCSWLTL
jgi:hypothetical protein